MDLIQKLVLLGFTDKEAQVYIELLKTGSTSIGKLEKELGEKRQTLIYSLKKLISKGYVNIIDSRSFPMYSAENPETILYDFNEKQKLLTETIGELKQISSKNVFETKVKFFPADQIENMLSKLEDAKTIYSITNFDYTIKNRKEELIEYRNRRMNDNSQKTFIVSYYTKEVGDFLIQYGIPVGDEYRFIEKGSYDFNINFEILLNKVLILSIDPKEKYAITVKSQGFYNSYKALFETLWNLGKTFDEVKKF